MNWTLSRTKSEKRAGRRVLALFSLFGLLTVSFSSCTLFKDRPIQLMSDTAAALRAAREVNADSLAPEKYRRANEAYFRAQNEYRLKNFVIAQDYALRAKKMAEEAELEALNQGSTRTSLLPPEIPAGPPPPSTIEPPRGELATEAMKRGSAPGPNGSGASSGGSSGSSSGGTPGGTPAPYFAP